MIFCQLSTITPCVCYSEIPIERIREMSMYSSLAWSQISSCSWSCVCTCFNELSAEILKLYKGHSSISSTYKPSCKITMRIENSMKDDCDYMSMTCLLAICKTVLKYKAQSVYIGRRQDICLDKSFPMWPWYDSDTLVSSVLQNGRVITISWCQQSLQWYRLMQQCFFLEKVHSKK